MKLGVLQFFGWADRSIRWKPSTRAPSSGSWSWTRRLRRVWLAEHHFSSFKRLPSVHMMGTMAAAKTSRLRIGTAVSLAAFYNPLRLAEEVALLDVLSGGRVNWAPAAASPPASSPPSAFRVEESGRALS